MAVGDAYFDPDEGYDLTLLHASVRTHDELVTVAKQAERDVRTHFTIGTGSDATVELDGYNADPVLATGYDATRADWTDFAEAYRRAIANVITHRLRLYDQEPGNIKSWTDGRRSRSYGSGSQPNPQWPTLWSVPLAKYQTYKRYAL